ncbi:hypothetical protein EDC04DRAFT_2668022 [Pisolithus marmoratus]|nr:hypothetical protein EDC04DRAFT_2668022 [Pisolithus marmoratus]
MSFQIPTPSTMPEKYMLKEASGIPLVHSSESQGYTTPQRFRRLLCTMLTGVPSLENFLETVEQEDETKWLDLKRRLVVRTLFIRPGCLLVIPVLVMARFLKPEPPRATRQGIPVWFVGLCAALSVVSGLGLVRFLNTIQPRIVKEIRSSTLKLTATAMLLAMPSLWFILCTCILLIAGDRAAWLDASTYLTVVVVVIGVGVPAPVPLVLLYFTRPTLI